MTLKQFYSISIFVIASMLVARPVFASGEATASGGFRKVTKTVCTTTYGGGTECRDEIIQEQIPQETFDVTEVNTGVAEWLIIISALFFAGLFMFVMAQKQLGSK